MYKQNRKASWLKCMSAWNKILFARIDSLLNLLNLLALYSLPGAYQGTTGINQTQSTVLDNGDDKKHQVRVVQSDYSIKDQTQNSIAPQLANLANMMCIVLYSCEPFHTRFQTITSATLVFMICKCSTDNRPRHAHHCMWYFLVDLALTLQVHTAQTLPCGPEVQDLPTHSPDVRHLLLRSGDIETNPGPKVPARQTRHALSVNLAVTISNVRWHFLNIILVYLIIKVLILRRKIVTSLLPVWPSTLFAHYILL